MRGAAPTAADISVTRTLALLDGPFAELAQGVVEGRYALWLGSGISRGRVDDLEAVIKRVLTYLRANANFGYPACTYVRALDEAIGLAQLSAEERMAFDSTQPIANWALLATIVDRLRNNYATFLDIRIDGHPADHLLWDVVDVPGTFADAALEPDCEHLCVALLVIECGLADIASANWDGLIEKAVDELSGGAGDILRVCVRDEDFRKPALRARLMKFHGCAVRASADPATYRALLVGQQSQIVAWPENPRAAVMRQQLINLATLSPTLMIGLSAQDANIQAVFMKGQATMGWNWPSHPPAYVFAEEVLGPDQTTLLKCVYCDAYDANRHAIEIGAQIRAFAKPLLTALVLYFLWRKLSVFLRSALAPHFQPPDFDGLTAGLRHFRNRVAALAEPDRLAFIRAFIQETGRALHLFREGRSLEAGAPVYRPLSIAPVNQIAGDPSLVTSGLPELAVALGVLGVGEVEGEWTIARADPAQPTSGAVQVNPTEGDVAQRLFFVANTEAALQLHLDGVIRDDEPDVVIVYSTAPALRQPRSPRSAPGRTGARAIREVGVRSLLRDSSSLAELKMRFREEAIL